jgi:transposase-like protein
MHTIAAPERARLTKRRHSAEFKAKVVEACCSPGVSVAGVALAHQLNANLVRGWIAKARRPGLTKMKPAAPASPAFISVPMITTPTSTPEIVMEIERGTARVHIRWPIEAASECSALLRDLLR